MVLTIGQWLVLHFLKGFLKGRSRGSFPAPVIPIGLEHLALKNNKMFFSLFKSIQNQVACFLAELCKAEKGVQKDKRNKHQTARYGCLAPRPQQTRRTMNKRKGPTIQARKIKPST